MIDEIGIIVPSRNWIADLTLSCQKRVFARAHAERHKNAGSNLHRDGHSLSGLVTLRIPWRELRVEVQQFIHILLH